MVDRLFGTNGIRGVYNEELTPEFMFKVAASIGSFFKGGRVLIARDGRNSGPILSMVAAAGLMDAGCRVYDIGLSTTPMAQYTTKAMDMDGGVMITASHNPPQYNGVKVIDRDGIEITREKEVEIENIYFGGGWQRSTWENIGLKVNRPSVLEEYKDALKKHVDVKVIEERKIKAVVDGGNGVGGWVTPYILKEVGVKVYTINSNIDGHFPARKPEPTLDVLDSLSQMVLNVGADFGVAHDGDADRAIFVDDKGRGHWGDRSFALIEEYYLRRHLGETVVTPISSSMLVEHIARKYEGHVHWTKVGSTTVSRVMVEVNAELGGEENGGIFYGPHLPVRDGAMASLLISEIIAESGERLSTLLDKLPRYYTVKRKIECPNQAKEEVLEKIEKEVSAPRVETIDGVKAWFKDESWVLIRPSGTEPIFRIFSEAKSEEEAERIADAYTRIVDEAVKKISRKTTC